MSVRIPKYRKHKSGQAFVQVKGERFYLGKYGTEESEEKYRRYVAELAVSPVPSATTPATPVFKGLEIIELCAAYWRYAQEYYVKDGQPTGHLDSVRQALRVLKRLYARTPAEEFGPLAFRAVQQALIDNGNARGYINHVCGVVKRIFKWGTSQELIPVTVYQALATVPGLKKGRTKAVETPRIKPVPEVDIQTTLPLLPVVVADMVRFQRLTGSRPGEVCILRPCDVDRSGNVWTYHPESHKTEHHGRERVIHIGPKAKTILAPYLLREADAYCFSPIESERKRRTEQRARRKTKVQPSQVDRRKARPKRTPRERYDANSYRRAIHRAVELVNRDREKEAAESGEDVEFLEKWSPNRLRHSAATEIRKKYGLESAQCVLGHAKADTTEIYAERDAELAREVARKIG